jgi:2-polyprenyl-3-methyl-5-hydroxy-6-metoxy-1,4-benzoquinol methylase
MPKNLLQEGFLFTREGVSLRNYRMGRLVSRLYRRCPKLFFRKIELSKLLMGGEQGRSASIYAKEISDILRPSRSIIESPHVMLLRDYCSNKEAIFLPEWFEKTSYFRNAEKCIELSGYYFTARHPKDIVQRARKFCQMLDGKVFEKHEEGENEPGSPVVVRRINLSDCYEIIHGQHQLAVAAIKGIKRYNCLVEPDEPVLTPLQKLILDSSWTKGQCELYQPISFPEVAAWPVVRKCIDRFAMMTKWLTEKEIKSGSYLDIGCSYGWFVSEMQKHGFQASGVDRDAAALSVGNLIYGIDKLACHNSDIVTFLDGQKQQYDVVSCFSVLHHFVFGTMRCSASDFIKKVDSITKTTLFFDTAEGHEQWFSERLAGWDAGFIKKWLMEHTSFTRIEILGTDADNVRPYKDQYQRHLFVCLRE